ncbi:MAG: hypothetical protein ACLRXQ_07520 [Phascolarctobacterium faecium]
MKFFLAAIVTAALLAEIIPVWAADPGNDKIKNKAPSVHTEADNSNGHPPEGISITPQTQAQRLAAATAKSTAERQNTGLLRVQCYLLCRCGYQNSAC